MRRRRDFPDGGRRDVIRWVTAAQLGQVTGHLTAQDPPDVRIIIPISVSIITGMC
jgi:hypothetical protein